MNTEHEACDPDTGCPRTHGHLHRQELNLRVLFSHIWAPAEHSSLAGSESKARCSAVGGSIWAPVCPRSLAGSLSFGAKKAGREGPAFLQPVLLLICSKAASGSGMDAGTRCDGLASERPVPAPSLPTGLHLLWRL